MTHGGIQDKRLEGRAALGTEDGPPPPEQGYDAVIPFNWVSQSNHPGAAAKEAPGWRRWSRKPPASSRPGDPVDLHFIGHSEGTVVNSQADPAAERTMPPRTSQAGYLKMTMLDPHAANNGVAGQQYSVAHGPARLGRQAGRSTIPVARPRTRRRVVPAERRRRRGLLPAHAGLARPSTNGGIYNLWGQVPVHGPAHYFNLTGVGLSHSGKFAV